jgi:hypothetical protein
VASNGTVQAKTWNPNGLAAVADLPCPGKKTSVLSLINEPAVALFG